eukprot:TRINITY_DN9266_c0_g2_i2.p3 TRINITY_DN9266_c0_g2~~TRINITY_DN9266_c0_g2_i2.p3  ORF type:complete len:108 (-),score=11.86 TRINITY_DN9266_c0_g2_i2:16-339(-)
MCIRDRCKCLLVCFPFGVFASSLGLSPRRPCTFLEILGRLSFLLPLTLLFLLASLSTGDGEGRREEEVGETMERGERIKRIDIDLSLIHICRCRRIERCRSRWSPYH